MRLSHTLKTCVQRFLRSLPWSSYSNLGAEESAGTIFLTACKATQVAGETTAPVGYGGDHAADASKTINSSPTQNTSPCDIQHSSRERYALLIGINHYGSGQDLSGCLNDVAAFRSMLNEQGYRQECVRTLTDEVASRAQVLQNIRWLVKDRQPDDYLFLHFSGHGSWTLMPSGEGWECCLCCSDCFRNWDEGIISRTDFKAAIARSSGNLFVILDCCFSGGMPPNYRTWMRLPRSVRKLLYDSRMLRDPHPTLRATAGPNWEPLRVASRRMGKSIGWLEAKVQAQELPSRRSRNGVVHVRVD